MGFLDWGKRILSSLKIHKTAVNSKPMTLTQYYDAMREVDGRPPRDPDPPNVSRIELSPDTPDNQGSITIVMKDGLPVAMGIYIWKGMGVEFLKKTVEEATGHKVEFTDWAGGNGHESCSIKILA